MIELDDRGLRALVEGIRSRIADLTPLMNRWKAIAVRAIQKRFVQEGPGWPKHSQQTVDRRGRNAPILRDEATLSKAIVGENASGFAEVGKAYVELGTTLKYARIHNFGGEIVVKARKSKNPDYRPRKGAKATWTIRMPQRRFLPNSKELMPDLIAEAEDYLQEILDAG